MLHIKRFASFEEAIPTWAQIEQQTIYYPFQALWYLRLFAKHFSKQEHIYLLGIYEDEQLLAVGAFELADNSIVFLGTNDVSDTPNLVQDITDFADLLYMPNVKQHADVIWETLFAYFRQEGFFRLLPTYLREDSPSYHYLQTKGQVHQVETSPYIRLPSSWEEYLANLSRKHRHELKRKIHRLEAENSYTFEQTPITQDTFDQFIHLHRLSDPNKAKFMTPSMEKFFWDIATAEKPLWETQLFNLSLDSNLVASVMVFVNQTHILLYNSGYNPDYAHFSVGLLSKAFLIQEAIQQKKHVYDFLRGNERYKYDLGAVDLPLFSIEINI